MANISEVLKKLKELLKLKEQRSDVVDKIDEFDYPKTKDELIKKKRDEVEHYPDPMLGVPKELWDEPVEPEYNPPKEPQMKEVPKPYPYNIIWMIRPPLFFLVVYLAFFVFKIQEIYFFYAIAWLFVWIIVGIKLNKDSFRFTGFFKGFMHIAFLYKLIPYFINKNKAKDYNENVYPKELDKYTHDKAEYQEKYDRELAEYNEIVKAKEEARSRGIESIIKEYEPEAEKEAYRQKKDYDCKVIKLQEELKELDDKIATYTGFDDSVAFHPDNFTIYELRDLIDVIEDCRASNIKEAMQLIREEERQERYEEQRREEAERQAEEAARLTEEHNLRMAEIERDRLDAMEKQNRETQKLLNASAISQARAACMGCVFKDTCSHMITGDVPIKCSKYRGTGFYADRNKK